MLIGTTLSTGSSDTSVVIPPAESRTMNSTSPLQAVTCSGHNRTESGGGTGLGMTFGHSA